MKKINKCNILKGIFIASLLTCSICGLAQDANQIDSIGVNSERASQVYIATKYEIRKIDSKETLIGAIEHWNDQLSYYTQPSSSPMVFYIGRDKYQPAFLHFRRSNTNGYPILYSPNDQFRIVSEGKIEFATNNRGISNGNEEAQMVIDNSGKVGIGTSTPGDKLTVAGGNISFYLPAQTGEPISVQLRDFWHRNEGSIGTTSNHSFTLYSNNTGRIRLDKEGYVVINGRQSDTFNQISQANKSKYSLFILGGALSDDYALSPSNTWADFVFNKDYNLKSLKEVEEFIETNNHLPEMPSALQVKEEGYSLHDMNIKLLQKVEELTLYVIQQNKEIENLKITVTELKTE